MANVARSARTLRTFPTRFPSLTVDHIFVNAALAGKILSSGFAHFNADFSVMPNRQDDSTPVRASDHDSPFVHLQPF